MSGPTVFQKFGMAVDRFYIKKVGATPIPGSKLHLLLVCFHPYEGKAPFIFEGGIKINPGDSVAELHLSNWRIAELGRDQSERSMEWRLMEMLKAEFTALANACYEEKISAKIEGFYGVNVLTAGAKRLGFTLIPIPRGWNRWWLGFWETILRKIFYSFKTKKKASFQKTKDPFEVWITRQELMRRYKDLKHDESADMKN